MEIGSADPVSQWFAMSIMLTIEQAGRRILSYRLGLRHLRDAGDYPLDGAKH